ncbi:MAG: hypothetical protein H6721_28055 [Sandaracinus sp.]|nr:hypothetical protein [Sandaracinus sp.]MCB9635982.1 hypothetical protein [Sandaracinus sp.]
MGTWGSGILQNDAAADGVCDAASELEALLRDLASSPSSHETAERMLGAIALLMRFSPYSFDPDNERRVPRDVVAQHRPRLATVSAEANAALDAILADTEPTYRLTTFSPRLARILHGTDARDFPMQGTWADAPEGVFDLAGARAVAQELADACVAAVDEDFENEEALEDPCREAFTIGRLALLLVLDGIHVDPAHFARWRDAWHAGRVEPDPSEADFFREYDASLEDAFAYGIERFTR